MKCGERALSLISLTFGLVAAGALALAVATDFWLFTIEPIVPSENETLSDPGASILETVTIDDLDPELDEEAVTMIDQNGPLIVHMHSGLWRACIIYHEPGLPPEVCTSIGYFEQSSERVEQADTTNSINRAIRKTAPIIVGSLFVLFFALSLSIVGTTKNDYKTIVSAVIYIFAALGLAMGVIMYISAVNDEVAHRKKTTDSSDKSFQYRYGWAFFFSAATFICAMVAAVSNISLYLLRYSNLEDKIVVAGGGGGMTSACHTTAIATAVDSRGYLPASAGEEKRPYYFPIYRQPQNHYYEAGFHNTYDGSAANFRNDERQQYVNSVAYSVGSGLGTAPWYGVPGTAFDFSKSGHGGYGGEGGHGGYGGYGGHGGGGYGGHGGGGYGGHGGGGFGGNGGGGFGGGGF